LKALARQTARMQAAGRIEGLSAEIRRLKELLAGVPLWQPAAGLERQCAAALALIEGITARLERSLVAVVIGPSGAGKSTLVNALAGGAELSPSGRSRPTTRGLVVLGRAAGDAAELAAELKAAFVPAETARGLCLVDTPDTDSTEAGDHREALERAVAMADVLICVFDAENPKRRDHADFLAPIVGRFDGQSLVAVLNKCDRLDEGELTGRILPDFRDYLQAAWQGAVDRALCLAARRHLEHPGWDEAARPRHAFDQFDALAALLAEAAGTGGRVIDRRVENARRITAWVRGEFDRELAADRPALADAARRIAEVEQGALAAAAEGLKGAAARGAGDAGARIYREIALKWIGPVGWAVAVWARLIAIGGGIAAVVRPARFRRRAPAAAGPAAADAEVLRRCRLAFYHRWPQAAEELIRGRFDPAVQRLDAAAAAERFAAHAAAVWSESLEREVDAAVRRMSGLWLQIAANLPVVAVLAYAGWVAVHGFFTGSYLPAGFFVHALWVVGIALALSFAGLQLVIRLAAAPERLGARAARRAAPRLAEASGLDDDPVRRQLRELLGLSESAEV
jgi:energy-coupling factor transporter ATP-binding protein EcfA2